MPAESSGLGKFGTLRVDNPDDLDVPFFCQVEEFFELLDGLLVYLVVAPDDFRLFPIISNYRK